MKILHIIVGLEVGGAEMMLKRLVESRSHQHRYVHEVISLSDIGQVGKELQALGVEVSAIGMRGPHHLPYALATAQASGCAGAWPGQDAGACAGGLDWAGAVGKRPHPGRVHDRSCPSAV